MFRKNRGDTSASLSPPLTLSFSLFRGSQDKEINPWTTGTRTKGKGENHKQTRRGNSRIERISFSNRLMKNLYPKGKGKIHPSPSPINGAGTDALAVLSLLPAAILALTTVLSYEDKQVLAYLITRCSNGSCAAENEKRRCRKSQVANSICGSDSSGDGGNGPFFDCGCFECYKSFWIRWDSSPERELIHQVIDAFEEHLASSERKAKGGRRRDRKEKGKKKKEEDKAEKEKSDEQTLVEERDCGEEVVVDDREGVVETMDVGVMEMEVQEEDAVEEIAGGEVETEAGNALPGGERRRPWPDVMGILNSRLWNLWGPGV